MKLYDGVSRTMGSDELSFRVSIDSSNKIPGAGAMVQELIGIVEGAGLTRNRSLRYLLDQAYSGKGIEATVDVTVEEFKDETEGGPWAIPFMAKKFVTLEAKGPKDNPTLHALMDIAEQWYHVHNPENYIRNKVDEIEEEL